MAVTYSATLQGPAAGNSLMSKVSNSGVSTAGPTSLEVITVVHGLGVAPDEVRAVVRSTIATPSGGGAHVEFNSANASQAILTLLSNDGGAVRANVDIVCQVWHSYIK